MAGIISNVAFSIRYQAYINPNGLMKMGFAVNLQGRGSPVSLLWRESVYNVSAASVRGVDLYAMFNGKQIILSYPFFAKGVNVYITIPGL